MDDDDDDVGLKINFEKKELSKDKMVSNTSFVSLPSAAIDHQIEVLLSEWSKNADMLFSIHPMDGSLLVWHVDWLDEYQPGMFRQVQVILLLSLEGYLLNVDILLLSLYITTCILMLTFNILGFLRFQNSCSFPDW